LWHLSANSNKARRGGSGSIESECVERLRLLHTCLCRSESSANGLLNAPSILESVPAITESLHLVSRPESLKLLFEIAVGIFSSGTKNRDSNQSVDELIECTGDLLRQGWRVLESEYLAVQHCWPPVAAYLRLLATEPICLGLPAAAPAAGRQILLEAIDSVLASSENRVGLAEALTRELLTTASVAVADCRGSWDEEVLLRLLLAGLIFGPVHRRFQRYAGRVHVYLETAYDKGWPFNMEGATRESSDRVPSLEFLCRLPQCACERHSGFVRSLLLRLRQHYDGLCQAKVYKNFTNSAAHRQKHRIFCALLCLAPHLPLFLYLHTRSTPTWSWTGWWHCLRTELIASVRSQTEWIISLLCLDSTTRAINMLYDLLESLHSQQFPISYTVNNISTHLQSAVEILHGTAGQHSSRACYPYRFSCGNQLLADSDSRLSDHVTRVLDSGSRLVPGSAVANSICMLKLPKLRLSSMAASAARLKDAAVESRLAQRSDFLRRSRHAFRKLGLLERHWWLSDFLPRGHLSPRFASADWLPRYQCVDRLHAYRMQCSQQPVVTVNSAASIEPLEQRQLLLPKSMASGRSSESAFGAAASAAGGLIIVASLIDKANNLGAPLRRSAESFGISDVCLPSLRLLGRSGVRPAVAWRPPLAPPRRGVRPGQPLLDFLPRQRASRRRRPDRPGADRALPADAPLPVPRYRRCLLLLGHEKRGIPPDLIGELDACLEIPMSGVVRSPEVHVSAALA
uniref:SpoU_methylase domain-containing protein n=1 Tax=Macrostomum lignano TaxID=282301 RepID=A0A1I8FAA9_9PLAT